MQSKEVHLAQHGAGTDDALAVVEQVRAKSVDQAAGVLRLGARADDGLGISADRLPAVLLESLDDLGGLSWSSVYRVFMRFDEKQFSP
jgi:hypothetical protein